MNISDPKQLVVAMINKNFYVFTKPNLQCYDKSSNELEDPIPWYYIQAKHFLPKRYGGKCHVPLNFV